MAGFKLKSCCFVVNLRLGTIFIGVICAVVEFITLVVTFSEVWKIQSIQSVEHASRYFYFLQLVVFMTFLFSCLKLALCASLFIGILERRPDHLEMWYKGYMICEIIYAIFIIIATVNDAHVFWPILIAKLLFRLITFYFILVVRSYQHQMCREPNFYQDFSYQQKYKTYSEKPKDAFGEIVLFAAPTKDNNVVINPSFTEGGGMVYATPQSAQMNLPAMPSFMLDSNLVGNDLYAVEKERQCSKPTKKNLNVSFYEN